MTVLLVAALLAAPAFAECRQLDLTLQGGVSVRERPTGDGSAVSAAMALGAGLSLHDCIDLPLRLELSVDTDLFGPPWGQGVDAVEVSHFALDLVAAAGPSYALLAYERNTFGVEALLAPGVRMVRVNTRLRSDSRTTYDIGLRLRLIAGIFSTLGSWRFALRVCGGPPWDDAMQALAVAGYQF